MEKETADKEVKLTTWQNEPSVTDLNNDLLAAEPTHKAHVANTEKWLQKLAGQLNVKIPDGRSKVQPKLIRKQAEWRYSSLEEPFLSAQDLFDIDPRTYEDYDAAEENQILINYQFNTKIDKVSFINEYVRTAVDEGTVFVQVGWKYEKGEREVYEEIELTPEQASIYLYQQVASGKMNQEEAIMQMQSGEPITKVVKRTKEVVTANHPTLRVCEFDRLIIDPTCEGDLEKAQFIITPFETSYSELVRDGSYKNLDQIFTEDGVVVQGNLDDATFYKTITNQTGFEFKDKARKKLTAYEYWGYWDIDGKGLTKPIKAVWVGNVMIKLEELPYPDKKLPFVSVPYLPVRKSVYGEPDGKLLEDNQDIIGAVTRGMIDVLGRSANGQLLIAKGLLDQANLKKYENGDHAYFNPGMDPRIGIHMLTYPEIPTSAMNMINLQNQEAESLTGVMAFNTGISGQSLGNMLDIDTDIPMADGSFKKLVDIEDGDLLVGSNGLPTTVLKAHEIKYPKIAYDMSFDNGSIVKSGGEHLWTVKVRGGSHKLREWTTMDTDEIYKHILKGRQVVVPSMKEMRAGTPTENTISPYVLGYWLGDGMSHSARITTADSEVLDKFNSEGYDCVEVKDSSKTGKAKMYDVYKQGTTVQKDVKTGQFVSNVSLHSELKALGLHARYGGNKHIPEEYFTATYEEKMELIRGLMDSDGYAHSGSFVQFAQGEGQLKDDFIRLIQSLGLTPHVVKRDKEIINEQKVKHYELNGGNLILATKDHYEIGFTPWSNPFNLTRKASKWKKPYKQTVTIKSMVIVDKVLMRCLTVDSEDKLFAVTDKYTLTHNTATGVRGALDSASKRELGILRRLSAGIEKIGRKIIAMNGEFLEDEEVIRVTNKEFRTIRRDALSGDFDLRVKVSTAESDNNKIEKLAFMMQTGQQSMDPEEAKLVRAEIYKLQKMPDLAEKVLSYKPQPDPMQEQMAQLQVERLQLENQKLKAEIEERNSRAIENQVDVELKQAKTQNELAKAGKTTSEKDLNDMEFLRKDMGVDHKENLENKEFDRLSKLDQLAFNKMTGM